MVETGTFRGEMVEAQRSHFQQIITIELDETLYKAAEQRFREDKKISVVHGDSGSVLFSCIEAVEGPILYWLDGHYSGAGTARDGGETPIEKELRAIVQRGQAGDVILIDDARLFGWRSGYPSVRYLRKFVQDNLPNHTMNIESDVICIFPKQGAVLHSSRNQQ